jgi:hypothetical protein
VNKKTKPIVTFQSYNPYEARYPGLRVVSRKVLDLMKTLRSNGYKVVVQPEDGAKLCYLTEKGVREFLSDPIVVLVLSSYSSLLIGLLTNWIYDNLKRRPQDNEINIVIEVDERGQKVRYSHSGRAISDERFQNILSLMENRARQYGSSLMVQPPFLTHPHPIFLEHTSQIIGWAGSLRRDEQGLRLDDVKITDEQAWLRIEMDDLTGFSIGGIIQKSTCSICNKDYVDCNHIGSEIYDGKECTIRIDKILIADCSVVKNPVQPLARIEKRHTRHTPR